MDKKKPPGRTLTPEEKALWDAAMQDVVKITRTKEIIPANKKDASTARQTDKGFFPSVPAKHTRGNPTKETLEKRQAKKLKQGKITIDAKIDLHGFTEDKAYQNLCKRLEAAYNQGKRCVLVVTGKGKSGTGILAQRVPEWLAGPELKQKIIRIAEALPQHGGSGALYVFLKKH